jgi:tartrate dehydratase beta subunit/fumarate hydratase class I family protein
MALYNYRVKEFSPLMVAMDSNGYHLCFDVRKYARSRRPVLYKKLGTNER